MQLYGQIIIGALTVGVLGIQVWLGFRQTALARDQHRMEKDQVRLSEMQVELASSQHELQREMLGIERERKAPSDALEMVGYRMWFARGDPHALIIGVDVSNAQLEPLVLKEVALRGKSESVRYVSQRVKLGQSLTDRLLEGGKTQRMLAGFRVPMLLESKPLVDFALVLTTARGTEVEFDRWESLPSPETVNLSGWKPEDIPDSVPVAPARPRNDLNTAGSASKVV